MTLLFGLLLSFGATASQRCPIEETERGESEISYDADALDCDFVSVTSDLTLPSERRDPAPPQPLTSLTESRIPKPPNVIA